MRAGSTFDGVVCFGGVDWWYHNHGHYDVQMMRELSARMPVLYVNSIGMRVPTIREGAMFRRRIVRKLGSLRRGMVQVRPHFAVLTGFALPGALGLVGRRSILPFQIRRAAHSLEIRSPLVWVAVPTAAETVEALQPRALVYQRTDRFESFTGVDRPRIEALDRQLKERADLTLFCSTALYERERDRCRASELVDHGVDFDAFAAAGEARAAEPEDMRPLPRPRVGFVGSIEAHTFDASLLVEVARRLPGCHFVLVGESTLPAGWCDLPNVTLLGKRPYERVAAYMAACDVLIMPWNRSPWIDACNPVKLKEYLAIGRPVISRPFRELQRYEGLVDVVTAPGDFALAIERALEEAGEPKRRRERVRHETWSAKMLQVIERLERRGVFLAQGRTA
jgi:glycosyltransferase involved in cell wall biosynthesis